MADSWVPRVSLGLLGIVASWWAPWDILGYAREYWRYCLLEDYLGYLVLEDTCILELGGIVTVLKDVLGYPEMSLGVLGIRDVDDLEFDSPGGGLHGIFLDFPGTTWDNTGCFWDYL